MCCWHCGESAQSSGGLLCFCGPTATCSLCGGHGCRFCGGNGWHQSPDAPEAVEACDELDAFEWRASIADAWEGFDVNEGGV